MKGKKGFVLYTKHSYLFEALTDEQAGKLIKKIYAYCLDKNPKSCEDGAVEIAFLAIKGDLLEDLDKWKRRCAANRENGALGGRPKKETEENSKNPNGFNENPNKPKKADKDKDKDKEKDKEEDKVLKESNTKEKTIRFSKPSIEEIKQYIESMNYLVDADKFYAYYESNGWKVGKNSMKDWKATLRTWNINEKERRGIKNPPNESIKDIINKGTTIL